jgi:hypothetical protein
MVQRSNDAASKDAQSMLKREECALSMEQRSRYVALMGARIKLRREECAFGMEQRLNTNDAASKVAQVLLRKEECVSGMVQKPNVSYAALGGAQIKPSREECVSSMVQRRSCAASKGVQINLNGEEYAGDMVHTATITMNLLLSHRVSVQILIRLL